MKIINMEKSPFHEFSYRSSGPKGKVRRVTLPFYRVKVDCLPEGFSSIVLTSDLQGREDNKDSNRLVGEAVAEELKLLSGLGDIPKVDAVLLAGDLYDYPDCRKLGGTGDVTAVLNTFSNLFPSVIGVLGNHDIVNTDQLHTDVKLLDGNSEWLGEFLVGGVSGIVGRENRNQRKSLDNFEKFLTKVLQKRLDVLILHQGPEDPTNQQIGEPMVNDLLNSHHVDLVVFGHAHWRKPFVELGKTQILNVDNRVYVLST